MWKKQKIDVEEFCIQNKDGVEFSVIALHKIHLKVFNRVIPSSGCLLCVHDVAGLNFEPMNEILRITIQTKDMSTQIATEPRVCDCPFSSLHSFSLPR